MRSKSWSFGRLLFAAVLVTSLLVQTDRAEAASPNANITSSAGLFPEFNPAVTDYVVRCGSSATTQVNVATSGDTQVAIADSLFRIGSYSTQVPLSTNQSFTIVLKNSESTSTHYVRCLPDDFPVTSVEKNGTPQAAGYLGVVLSNTNTSATRYNVYFDNNGVPVWWSTVPESGLIFGTLLPNNNIGIATMGSAPATDTRGIAVGGVAREETLDGTKVNDIKTVNSELDQHEIIRLDNGNYLLIANVPRANANLTSIGGPASGTLLDQQIQEVTPTGALVWSWTASEHISLTEVDDIWWPVILKNNAPYDTFHANSIEVSGNDVIVSFRHLDALYKINRISGAIEWKLGGLQTPQSLAMQNDPISNFGGQHDARVLSDGTLALHDNQSLRNVPPRAVRYSIDENARTATLVESVSDTAAPLSICCGSARKLPGGNWVTYWGANPYITELTPAGSPVLRILLTGSIMYRVEPVMPDRIDTAEFRAAMDRRHPTAFDAGYMLIASNGSVTRVGSSISPASAPMKSLNSPIVDAAVTQSGKGRWIFGADGGVFNDGDAGFFGSMGGKPLNAPIVGAALTPSERGYWLVAADGGVFAFGDATFHGSAGNLALNAPIVGISASANGDGYILVASDGGVFSYGSTQFFGSLASIKLNAPITTIAPAQDGKGYLLVASDGGVFAFGSGRFAGSAASLDLNEPITSIALSASGNGYWLSSRDGGVFAFGDAKFKGSLSGDSQANYVAIRRTSAVP